MHIFTGFVSLESFNVSLHWSLHWTDFIWKERTISEIELWFWKHLQVQLLGMCAVFRYVFFIVLYASYKISGDLVWQKFQIKKAIQKLW